MKINIIIICFTSICLSNNANLLMDEGNELMINEKYENAIKIYESILNLEYESAQLYFNLGNAYFRRGQIGNAIWSYMNAQRIEPRNDDVKYNLEIANASIIDRIEMPRLFVLVQIYKTIRDNFTMLEWLSLGSIFLLLHSIYYFMKKMWLSKVFRNGFISLLLLLGMVFSHLFALEHYLIGKRNRNAIVISNAVDAYSGPFFGKNKILFQVNEGSMAEISKIQKNWFEIVLIDGKKGWVEDKHLRLF